MATTQNVFGFTEWLKILKQLQHKILYLEYKLTFVQQFLVINFTLNKVHEAEYFYGLAQLKVKI